MRAFTRAVSPKLPDCALTHLDRTLIDVARAVAQHAAYEQALADAGCEVIRLPELADDPDAVFVEDTALLLDGHAVITRPGVASRAGETESTAADLTGHFEVHRIASGFVDGGDVLRIGRTLYVGLSTRTDAAGIRAFAELVDPLGYQCGASRTSRLPAPENGRDFRRPGRERNAGPALQRALGRSCAVRRCRAHARRRARTRGR